MVPLIYLSGQVENEVAIIFCAENYCCGFECKPNADCIAIMNMINMNRVNPYRT